MMRFPLPYVEEPIHGSAPDYPFGEDAQGIIMYTPDGFMSAQLSQRDRAPFASDDWYKGLPRNLQQQVAIFIRRSDAHVDESSR